MNKKLGLILGLAISSVCVIAIDGSTSDKGLFSRLSALSNGKWVHYAQRDATEQLDGVREYWVQCGGGYQFTAPSGTIEEASYYDTSEFSENDPRWIKYMHDEAVFYDLSTSSINSCEIGEGYETTTSHATTEGSVVKATFTKDDSSCWYYGDLLTVTKVINDGATLKDSIWMPNKSAIFNGYYVLGQDIPEGFTNDSSSSLVQTSLAFAGVLDGRGHTVDNVKSSYQAGIFGTKNFVGNGKYGYLKNITFTNFASAAYGLLGWNAQHIRLVNVSISLKGSCTYLLGGSFNGDMDIRNCYFDISLPGTCRVFAQKYASVVKDIYCENVTIKNDLSKTHVFYGNITEEYNEPGVTWVNTPAIKKEGEVLFYDISNKSLYTSELSTDLEGYSFYGDAQGTQEVDFSSITPGTVKSVYALKEGSKKYEIDCTVVSKILQNRSDFITWSQNRTSTSDTGYYILNCDLVYPTSNVMSGAHTFTGTFDGRGHTITYTLNHDSNYGLFGQVTSGGKIKNLNVDGINRGYAIGWSLWNGHLENCTFTAADTINRSTVGLIVNTVRGTCSLKDITIKNKYNSGNPVIAVTSYTGSTITYDNVKVECLDNVVMYTNGNDGKGQNPNDITYKIITKKVIDYDKGVTFNKDYVIKYVSSDTAITKAATALRRNINKDTALGFSINVSGISATDSVTSSTKAIVIGSTKSFTDAGFTLSAYTKDLNSSGYVIVTKDNAVYIVAVEASGYQLAVNKFLEITLGFDCLGLDAYIYTRDGSVIPEIVYYDDADILERKADAYFDVYHANDAYSMNYNNPNSYFLTFKNKPIYTDKAGNQSTSSNNYHTIMMILPAPTYYGTHREWYATYTDTSGVYSNGYEKTAATGALCFTAGGDATSYASLVDTFSNNLISECEASNNWMVNIGNTDGDGYCKCNECKKHNASYNFVKFLNDVSANITGKGKTITMSFLCYKAYLPTPDDPNLRCADNLIPFVAPIRANYYRPLNDTTYNSSSKTPLEGWANIANTCYAWIYDANFNNLLYPYNSYQTTVQNIVYLHSLGYSLIFPENLYSTGNYGNMTAFSALKFYLEGKVMVDTEISYQDTFDKFFKYYYGKGEEKMKTMFNEVTTHIENRFIATSGSVGSINDNEGNMNTSMEGKPYRYEWKYADMSSWRNYCNSAIALETNEAIIKRLRAERVFPNWSLSTLFASNITSDGIVQTVHDELIRDCNELNIYKWKEGDAVYTGGNSNLNAYFATNNWCISGEKLVYTVSTGNIDYSQTTTLLSGYSYYADEKKTAISWTGHTAGDEFVVFAMKDNSPTYLVKVQCV